MRPLVTTDWLAARLHDPNTIVFDATLAPPGVTPPIDTHARYLAEHLPGALFFDIEALSEPTTSLPHMPPAPEAFAAAMSALGVSDTSLIVVYEQTGVFSAPRARWMLRTLGAQNVCILDGGLSAWLAAGLPAESGPVRRATATFHATLDASAIKNFTDIQQLSLEHGQILDARSTGRFAATAPEPRPGLSSGHMPNATSLPFTDLLDAGRLKPSTALAEIFHSKGIHITQPITATCGSGVTAAVLALGLELVGAPNVTLYDGSWAEYAQHPEAIIETSA